MRDEQRASELRLEVVLRCTRGIAFEFDSDARYLNVWTYDDALLVAPPAAVLGKTIEEVIGPEPALGEVVRRVHRTGVAEVIEYELPLAQGTRYFAGDVIVQPAASGESTVVVIVRDVTAHKELEERLRQAQKMEAIGQLAGGIAHDFNNILTTITGYTELMLEQLPATSPYHKHATRIRQAANRASGLTSQLLDYARRRHMVPEVLDVNGVIESIARMLKPLIGEHIALVLDLGDDVGGARADRSSLEQVIMNMAINARDAMPAGGTLTLRTRTAVLTEDQARIVDLSAGRYAEIVATDTGHGMDAATRARMFEPFFTTKAVGKGTGLGMSTVYGIVKQSGGHVSVDSEPGHGTSIRVLVPWMELPPVVDAPVDHAPRRAVGTQRVLVVEDDDDIRGLIERYLRVAGYDVMLANDGLAALELARAHTVDVLVTDVVMPVVSGDVLAQQLRELQPAVRVLYISGYPDEHRTGGVPRVEGSGFLAKPFTPAMLIREVGALFDAPTGASGE